MSIITLPEVQAWLEATKLTLTSYDTELESVAKLEAFSSLSEVYDTSTWVDTATTPDLVERIMAMLVAAWTYRRQYSEDTDSTPDYADWLEGMARDLLAKVRAGTLLLSELPGVGTIQEQPDFYPQDDNFDTDGNRIDDALFTVSQRF